MSFERRHDFLVAIDSDGCVFDTVEIKVKECFIPEIVRCWDLQPLSRFARAAAEFVILYSKNRGINRFPALVKIISLLAEWPAARRRMAALPDLAPLGAWIARGTPLSNRDLEAEVARSGDPVLARALDWSAAVNRQVERIVRNVPPFPLVRECLAELSRWADLFVCSTTPTEAVEREWREHGLDAYVRAIQGQEFGPKSRQIAAAARRGYDRPRILMLGDAPGDRAAVQENGGLFFPIEPGREETSWDRFHSVAMARFRSGAYSREYESGLVEGFDALLASEPPWKR